MTTIRSAIQTHRAVWLVLALGVLTLSARGALAQTSAQTGIEEVRFRVLDTFDRPYDLPKGTLAVGVRLTSDGSPNLKGLTTLEAEGVEYRINSDEYLEFPVTESKADLRFVVFKDADKNPVTYEITLLKKKGTKWITEPIRPSKWTAGQGKTTADARASSRAPLKWSEIVLVLVATLLATALVYAAYGQLAFRRLLFNRRNEVQVAERRSKFMVLIGSLIATAAAVTILARPQVVYGNPLMIHFLVWGAFLALLAISTLITVALTTKR